MVPRLYDMAHVSSKNSNPGSGKNYAVTDPASLPAAFTADFNSVVTISGATSVGPQMEFHGSAKISIQVFLAVAGAGLSKVTATLYASNIGGTHASVWSSLGTKDTGATAGSVFIDLPADAVKRHKFYRVDLTSVDGASTCYVVGFGYAES